MVQGATPGRRVLTGIKTPCLRNWERAGGNGGVARHSRHSIVRVSTEQKRSNLET